MAWLSIRKESGEQLAASDDRPNTTDPGLDFKNPDGVDKIVVAVKDLLDRGGPEYLYRFDVSAADAPDFRLALFEDQHQTPRGGAELVRVRAERAGYNGPIKLAIAGLPPGVTLINDEIPAGATDALLTLVGNDAALSHAIVSITGTNADGGAPRIRPALSAATDATRNQPWLRNEVAMAVTPASSLSIQWEGASPTTALPLGGGLPAQLKVTRAPLAAGAVRISMITSQITPKKEVTGKDNKKSTVDDVERSLRLEASPMLAADAASGAAKIIVPADLPGIPYDVAFKAELLSADGKTVMAKAVTPALRLATVQPLKVALAGEAKVEAKAGSGETGQLKGTIERIGDFAHPVTVTLAGLPADYVAPTVEVPADKSEFSLPVAFAFNSPPGDLPGVSVVATAQPAAGASVRSNEVPVAVKVVAGGPPPALYRLFEDESHFANLVERREWQDQLGDDRSLFRSGIAAGDAGIKNSAQKCPAWESRSFEKPGEGEYRYLRYAWKKVGGGNVLLQLGANGAWGPARRSRQAGVSLRGRPGPQSLGRRGAEALRQVAVRWDRGDSRSVRRFWRVSTGRPGVDAGRMAK